MSADRDPGRLVVRRRIAGTREELFDAWTDPQGMRVWMCPRDIVSSEVRIDLRVGGSLLIVMHGPHRTYEHRGEITVLDRPSKFTFTWIADATDGQPTLVTVEFLAVDPGLTEIVLTHEKFPRPEARDRYVNGWGQILDRLERHLQAGPGPAGHPSRGDDPRPRR